MHLMQSHYNINVAERIPDSSRHEGYRYVHYFNTLIDDRVRAQDVYASFLAKYPEPKFKVTITRWEGRGRQIDGSDFLLGTDV